MDYAYIILTVIAVSIDSFFAGFAYKGKPLVFPSLVFIVTFIMCFLAMKLGALIADALPNIKYVGCAILAAVGVANIFRADDMSSKWLGLALAVGVATDGAVASFSFALVGIDSVWVVLGLAVTHFVCTFLGSLVSRKLVAPKYFNVISGVTLIVLAILKLIEI